MTENTRIIPTSIDQKDDTWTVLERSGNDGGITTSKNLLFHSAMDLAQERQLMNELPDRLSRDEWVATAFDAQRRLAAYRCRIAELEREIRRLSRKESDDWEQCTIPDFDSKKTTKEEDIACVVQEMLSTICTKAEGLFLCINDAKAGSENVLGITSRSPPTMHDVQTLTARAAVAVDRLTDLWNERNRFSMQISFTSFAINDIALFFPTKRGHYEAFNIGAPNHFLSEECKALIGKCRYFQKEFVLGRIIQLDMSVASAFDGSTEVYGLPKGTPYTVVAVAGL